MSQSRSAWTEAGPQDLGGGVHRIALPLPNDGLRAVNVYALEAGAGLVLIDGGWALAESEQRLVSSLDRIGFGLSDIATFLVTHMHRDHYTQAVAVRRKVGSRVSLGIGEQANLLATRELSLQREYRPGRFPHLLRTGATALLVKLEAAGDIGRPGPAQDWEPPDSWLRDGVEVPAGDRRLQVIATPGHTQGHVVFHDAEAGLLFAGDHVLPQITPSVGLEAAPAPFPLRDYLGSLRLMFTLPDAMLLPAHGPVTTSVHQRVTELLAHHENRLAASAAAVAAGADTAFDAALALPWTRHNKAFSELDPENQLLAVTETAAHLDVLVLQRRLSSSTSPDGIEFYRQD
ncbi:MAG TPA: MBL fold metallo-hydrolase [Jatrophihabitans sp.]|uniref:MBL fold metallo-hydrolase n=1 Tax=Jatrophihabitans sp. TaxID=1932789 RepID=UPI002F0E7E4A